MAMDLDVCLLFNIYGKVLTDRQYEIMEQYYMYDCSLAEIATSLGIARQTVRDALVSGKNVLLKMDEKLKFKDLVFSTINGLKDLNDFVEGVQKQGSDFSNVDVVDTVLKKIKNLTRALED